MTATREPWAKIPRSIVRDHRLGWNDVRIYVALASFADRAGKCFPRRKTLTKHLRLPIARVSEITTRLQRLGWVRKYGNGGRSMPVVYYLMNPLKFEVLNTEGGLGRGIREEAEVPLSHLKGAKTVPQKVTVPKTKTDTKSGIKTVTDPARGIEQQKIDKHTSHSKNIEGAPEEKVLKDFQRIWDAYPKKVQEKKALSKFREINASSELVEKILSSIRQWRQSDQWRRDGGRFVPYLARWLDEARWEDEIQLADKYSLLTSDQVQDLLKKNKDMSASDFEEVVVGGESMWFVKRQVRENE